MLAGLLGIQYCYCNSLQNECSYLPWIPDESHHHGTNGCARRKMQHCNRRVQFGPNAIYLPLAIAAISARREENRRQFFAQADDLLPVGGTRVSVLSAVMER